MGSKGELQEYQERDSDDCASAMVLVAGTCAGTDDRGGGGDGGDSVGCVEVRSREKSCVYLVCIFVMLSSCACAQNSPSLRSLGRIPVHLCVCVHTTPQGVSPAASDTTLLL